MKRVFVIYRNTQGYVEIEHLFKTELLERLQTEAAAHDGINVMFTIPEESRTWLWPGEKHLLVIEGVIAPPKPVETVTKWELEQ